MILAGSDHFLAVPVEATAFLGAVAGFVVLLLALFLYLSRKWCFTPPSTTTLFGGVCVPLCEPNNGSTSQITKNIGKAFSYSDPETSSDSEEDVLRRLNSHTHPPPDTLTIQAEDGPTILDAGTTSSSCTEEHSPSDQQQCVVEVGASGIILDNREQEVEVEQNGSTTNDVITTMGTITEEVGSLEVAFLYDAPMREMTVHVLQGRNYPEGIGGSQVRLVLLPSKKQRRKTRVRQGTSPQYMESFLLPRVNPEDVNAMGVRLRVYLWGGRMRRERLLGEARVSFDQINLQLETTLWLTLQPPPFSSVQDWGTTSSLTRSDSTGSQQSVQSYASPTARVPTYASHTVPPYGSSMKGGSVAEILIGLAYNGTTGRLSVEIIKGSHFRGGGGNDTKPPDTYVKLALMDSNGHEMERSKTGLKRAQPNPLYKETFIFQVALFQLGDVTLFLSVYNRRRGGMGRKGREMIGWLSLGLNSSGTEELQHWNDMRAARQPAQVQRWHSLLRP
ncbi:synaptotagmin-14 [Bombus vosnesenskii]|uniref:Synaptotagmin-14 n=3 Tax=Pyrobombus TaxID=144703 RepID=A0A6J3JXY9_9HYME|nr:synaptotagmin-14 [Bombus impatiens]XP_033189078.1 synaptotagmin-14 [Bombus vancouverensis nearcticus]XP_033303899.1 synaptotagmin-14 [Bombus bifarius]XP_033344990.1 synaptotagmin-14 [Bombus vosnesenskii]XP_050487502.1 synaptotagmin-14 [Bombus huntii]